MPIHTSMMGSNEGNWLELIISFFYVASIIGGVHFAS